jgi:predicted ATP-grasp superfamily ATP-dependent carboligase
VWDGEVPETDQPFYFQKRAAGSSISAQFLATPAGVEVLGVTRQLVGLRGVHAPPFAWCGNLYPAEFAAETVESMTAIGRVLATAADLRGLFGCDFIVSEGVPYLTEVNPRYTAAMELIEHRVGHSLVARHVTACSAFDDASRADSMQADPSEIWHSSSRITGVIGKIVLYAEQDLIADDARALLLDPLDDRLPFVADLPDPGQIIPAGHPVCTLFATERHEDACIARLLRCAKRFRQRFLRPLRGISS